ncbi:hypothetical protein HaLaN_26612, partial [Haematococcus lacustris]
WCARHQRDIHLAGIRLDICHFVLRCLMMVLQAQQMQMEVLEVRAQAAILQNRT